MYSSNVHGSFTLKVLGCIVLTVKQLIFHEMIEIGHLINLNNGDLHNPNENEDFLDQENEQIHGGSLYRNNTVSLQTSELNSVQAQLHGIDTSSNNCGARNDTDRNGHIWTHATTKPFTKYNSTHVEGRLHTCELCEHSNAYSWRLKTHKLIQIGEKPYQCDECDYSTPTYGALKTQKLIQTGKKPYKCSLCQYSTAKSSAFKTHKLIHSGEKPFKCNLCDFKSTLKGNLQKHILVHSGEKPYKCDICDYRGKTSITLRRHKLAHSGEKPYKCDLCNYSAT